LQEKETTFNWMGTERQTKTKVRQSQLSQQMRISIKQYIRWAYHEST